MLLGVFWVLWENEAVDGDEEWAEGGGGMEALYVLVGLSGVTVFGRSRELS